jgi:excinuclease ABC subunit A
MEARDMDHQYYAQPGLMTDLSQLTWLPVDLPESIAGLVKTVQGLLLPVNEAELYHVQLNRKRRATLHLVTATEMLDRIRSLDERPLNEPRPPAEQLAASSRDHAVLLCALLRIKGIPARVRAGFTIYSSQEQMKVERWIVEVRLTDSAEDGTSGWQRVDPQVDEAQRMKYAIQLDTLDIPEGFYLNAGQAWRACRLGKEKSGEFGLNRKKRGWNFLRSSLLKDLACLNKVEPLPRDDWFELSSKGEDKLTPADRQLLDRIAELTSGPDVHFEAIRRLWEDDEQFGRAAGSRLFMLGLHDNRQATPGGTESEDEGEGRSVLMLRPSDLNLLLADAPAPQDSTSGPSPAIFLKPSPGSPMEAVDPDLIVVRGAQQHNLKRIDVNIPRHKLVVLTGVSGSGKSSLAFDTLYAEGQRRYVESLSAYVRRYLDQMDKPKVDYIGGLSPAIAIEQKSVSKNPRSTVGTVTEVLDYLRVLYSRAGIQHCPQCGRAVEPASAQQVADRLLRLPSGSCFQLLSPIWRNKKGDHTAVLEEARRGGFTRARLDGEKVIDLLEPANWSRLRKSQAHTIDLVVDRLTIPAESDLADPDQARDFRARLIDSVETALQAGKGLLNIDLGEGREALVSERRGCPHCELDLPELTATLFSFNAPTGMCPQCNGLGTRLEVDLNLVIEHPNLSLLDGASRWHGNLRKKKGSHYHMTNLQTLADHYGVGLEAAWQDLPKKFRDVVLYGSGGEKIRFKYENESGSWKGESFQETRGIIFHIKRLFRQTKSDYTRRWYASFMSQQPCQGCGGSRLRPEARHVTVGGKTLPEITAMTIEQALHWVDNLAGPLSSLNPEQLEITGEVIKELHERLQFMMNVGLHYLTLERPAPTLSGGEGQRIRLASQLGCGLVGVLYILDEPSIGLHARDQRNLLATLARLRDMGNTVLVVEHDAETMLAADWLIDLGPGAGMLGGDVVSAGTPADVASDPHSLTGRYLSGSRKVVPPNGSGRRAPHGWLELHGARLFNLKDVTACFPLGTLTCVTGVSGSGKSSLVAETLYPALSRALNGAQANPGPYERLEGLDLLDKVINITQEPIGRTPRSNPATYVGVFDEIRRVFAATLDARMHGYKPDRFSFNVKGGRCESCRGHGQKKIEMHFLPDVWVTCQECKGKRYNRHTLEVRYKDRNIAEVLKMDVQEALDFFGVHTRIQRVLQTLHDVGLDYVKLGQSATTLSGGEAQRVKLAKELSRVATGRTIYILDEPTTGLHFADIQRLLDVLHRLVEAGNTVIVIEHNLDVIKTADWIIDLGPEGGEGGGYVIAEGTPEEVAQVESSYTGQFLRR